MKWSFNTKRRDAQWGLLALIPFLVMGHMGNGPELIFWLAVAGIAAFALFELPQYPDDATEP